MLTISPLPPLPRPSPGDNIYEEGVESVTDPLWSSRYCSVYTDPSILDIPWYAILGNHDYYSGYVLQNGRRGGRDGRERGRKGQEDRRF